MSADLSLCGLRDVQISLPDGAVLAATYRIVVFCSMLLACDIDLLCIRLNGRTLTGQCRHLGSLDVCGVSNLHEAIVKPATVPL